MQIKNAPPPTDSFYGSVALLGSVPFSMHIAQKEKSTENNWTIPNAHFTPGQSIERTKRRLRNSFDIAPASFV